MADAWNKKYVLKHKNIPVAEIELDEATSAISAIGEVYDAQHVPIGIPVKKGRIDRAALNEWWRGRAIPASRDGIQEALAQLKLTTTQKLLDKSLGLSLSDQYWICPPSSDADWSQVNFFDNTFSEDVGNVLLGKGVSGESLSLISPDNTSDGWLKKKWTLLDGKRCLVKGGSGAIQQEPYNEVLASRLMERLRIPHVSYTLLEQENYPYSVCEDFITPRTELVTAWYVMQTRQKPNHVSVYRHYVDCCEALGVPGIVDALDRMIVVDYLIANEDRHQNNFGVIRNAETLEWIGAAPIYDSGSSLWFSKPLSLISPTAKLTCKPFKNDHNQQIKLVTSFDWLDLSALHGLAEEFRDILKDSLFIDAARRDALCSALQKRIDMLAEIVHSRTPRLWADDRSADVLENIAYSGTPSADDGEPER
ncbi:HipA domain-containing protein [Paenibacillus macerans]|uniref:HipA domain-containing protein n=1 Tax=Paenibacillus macerans TaxID=44252 RepID=UPI00203EB366|nr:HipA domain-containing protein [Paenibacillus macerans]MCM3699743.1 HipA domain-containing protein [Paenibacillus macerans]